MSCCDRERAPQRVKAWKSYKQGRTPGRSQLDRMVRWFIIAVQARDAGLSLFCAVPNRQALRWRNWRRLRE